MDRKDRLWFTRFIIEDGDGNESEVVWAEAMPATKPVRKPTPAEKRSILLVGGLAFALLVAMVVTLIVGVYLTRR